MRMLIEFDVDADIIDVPQFVIDNRNRYRNQFYKWLSDPKIKHKYWQKVQNRDGTYFMGCPKPGRHILYGLALPK